jgi:uncharacterized phage-associated protein
MDAAETMSAPISTSAVDDDKASADSGSQRDIRGGQPVAKDARAVANYFIELADRRHDKLTPMQLLKLVYIAHGWHLAWHELQLFGDDVEAWRHGPVIASVYHAFKKYGRDRILRPTYGDYDLVIDIGLLDPNDKHIRPKPISARFTPRERQTMEEVDRAYRGISGLQLSQMTHQNGSPWDETYRTGENAIIKNEIIKKYYEKLDEENRQLLEEAS